MNADVDTVQSALLAATVVLALVGFLAVAGRLRDAKLLTLLVDETRRLERVAERVGQLVEVAGDVGDGSRPREAFGLAQLRLAEALATLPAELPDSRRLLLLEPEHAERIRMQARAALAEVADRVLETEIDRDGFTLGFAWARRRRRIVAARIENGSHAVPGAETRRAA